MCPLIEFKADHSSHGCIESIDLHLCSFFGCVQSCHVFSNLTYMAKAAFQDLPDRHMRHDKPSWMSRLDEGILSLTRTTEVFSEMEKHPYIKYDLPAKGLLPGKVLKHIYGVLDQCIEKKWPMIYKLGATHNPPFRYSNNLYGYEHEKVKWDGMTVCFCSAEPTAIAFAEAAAIQKYKGPSPAINCLM